MPLKKNIKKILNYIILSMDFSFRSESIKMTFTVQNKEILQENHLLNILFMLSLGY